MANLNRYCDFLKLESRDEESTSKEIKQQKKHASGRASSTTVKQRRKTTQDEVDSGEQASGEGDKSKEQKTTAKGIGRKFFDLDKYKNMSTYPAVIIIVRVCIAMYMLYLLAIIRNFENCCQEETLMLNNKLELLRKELKEKESLLQTAEFNLDKEIGELVSKHLQTRFGEHENVTLTGDIIAEKTSENMKQERFDNETDLMNKIVGAIKEDIVKIKSRFERIDYTLMQVREEWVDLTFSVKQVNDTLQNTVHALELNLNTLENFIRDTIIINLLNKDSLLMFLMGLALLSLTLAVFTYQNTRSLHTLREAFTNQLNQTAAPVSTPSPDTDEAAKDENVSIEYRQKLAKDETEVNEQAKDGTVIDFAKASSRQEFQQEAVDDGAFTESCTTKLN